MNACSLIIMQYSYQPPQILFTNIRLIKYWDFLVNIRISKTPVPASVRWTSKLSVSLTVCSDTFPRGHSVNWKDSVNVKSTSWDLLVSAGLFWKDLINPTNQREQGEQLKALKEGSEEILHTEEDRAASAFFFFMTMFD